MEKELEALEKLIKETSTKEYQKQISTFNLSTKENIIMCSSLDELLEVTYNYVRDNNVKCSEFKAPKILQRGFQTSDDKFFMIRLSAARSGEMINYAQLVNDDVDIADFINKQMWIFS